ncbi:MAG: type II secretion system F family protein [Patescibacteria group bacterium]|jgi:type IV pilus assembly protein PilC
MAQFKYLARNQEGKKEEGEIEAKNKTEAGHILQNKELRVLTISEKKETKGFELIPQRISSVDKIFFTQNLYIMVRTGFSLAQGLKTLVAQTENKRFRSIIDKLRADVEKGITLSKAMAKFPKVFNELFVNMIASGEISGKLEDVLQQLTLQMKKDHALLSKVKSAMMYPLIITVAMLGLGIGMIVYVIPQIQFIFEGAGVQLPLPTRIVLGLSDLLQNDGVYLFIGLIIVALLYRKFLKTERGKLIIHKIMLKSPILGGIVRKVNIARFTRNLSSLLKTDIPIVQAFTIIERTLGNIYYKKAMKETSEKVKEGVTISQVLGQFPDLFPPILIQMVSVGEQSGTLEVIADEIAQFYEEDVDQTMNSLPTILEPVIMLMIGAAAGGLVAAIILPIYSLSDAI